MHFKNVEISSIMMKYNFVKKVKMPRINLTFQDSSLPLRMPQQNARCR